MAVENQAPTAAVRTGPIENVNVRKPHTSSNKLKDQAATAALYVTKHDEGSNSKSGYEFLDKNHKLSSAGAAASLKYANPQDLPSYPTAGLKGDSAAGTAASLGWANQKPFEHWKPDSSASASAAAMMAKDYKMAPLWQPGQSASGAKAALLAHRDGGKVDIWQPESDPAWGNSAAAQAFKKFGAGTLSPVLDYGYTSLGRQGSLLAATGAMATGRKRAESSPVVTPRAETYPDENNAAANALSAATSASSRGKRTGVPSDGGAVPYTNMSREMYTANPPVAPEVEEQNYRNSLRASAIAMAQGMYNVQQKQFEAVSNAQLGASAAHGRTASIDTESDEVQPMRFNNLQEAAQKLAQERLAKLHDEFSQNREYREYYGSSIQPQSKLSVRGRARRRASSDNSRDQDKEQSNKIRAQMSLFSSNLSQVDQKKRQQDREALIAVAQRNVTKSLHGMDERVFADTGKVSPSLLSEWEVKAHAAAQAKSDTRMENHGKVHIGGGKFVNQSAIDLVAKRNVQPVLDEINEKAEVERERQAALKLEQETQARKAAEKKSRERESKEINKKLKQQEKDEEKMRKADEKAAKKEEERLAKEKRKSTTAAPAAATIAIEPVSEPAGESAASESTSSLPTIADEEPSTLSERRELSATPAPIRTSMEDQASIRMRETAAAANGDEVTPIVGSPTSPTEKGKVKNWLKSKFSKRASKNPRSPEKEKSSEAGFVGGAALTGASVKNGSTASLGAREPAIASEPVIESERPISPEEEERIGRPARRASEVSSVSTIERAETNNDEFLEAQDNFDEALAPPPTFPAEKSSSPVRDSKFVEQI